MRKIVLRCLCLAAALLLWFGAYPQVGQCWLQPQMVHAAAPYCVLPKHEVDAIVGSVAKRSPGVVVVGLIDEQGRTTYSFGNVLGKPASGDTIFETASLSKVFSGLLLSQMIARGDVSANEPVDQLIGRPMPHVGCHRITLYQLATHTSGLPLWPANRSGSCSRYSTANMMSYLNGCRLDHQPGATMVYSNVGYALLGDALARKAAKPCFEQLLEDNVCKPLGMHDTRVSLTPAMKARLALGHTAGGAVETSSSPTAGGGADGIRSSVNDLLKLVSAYLGSRPASFASALKISRQRYEPVDDMTRSGFGWYIDTPTNVVWKSGRLSGYRSFVAFSPDHHAGVVVLSSCTAFPAPELGKRLLTLVTKQRRS